MTYPSLRHPECITVLFVLKENYETRSDLLCIGPLVVETDKSDYVRGTLSILMLDHLNAKHRD